MTKSVVIIGAGMAGLAAGCYGKLVTQLLCKQDGKRFVTSKVENPIPVETASGKYPGRLEREGRLSQTS
jgi:thioredoxin reductase